MDAVMIGALGMHVTPAGDVYITVFLSSYKLGVDGAAGTVSVPGNQTNAHDNSLLGQNKYRWQSSVGNWLWWR